MAKALKWAGVRDLATLRKSRIEDQKTVCTVFLKQLLAGEMDDQDRPVYLECMFLIEV